MIKFLLDPFHILWLIVLGGLIFLLFRKTKAGQRCFLLSGVWFLLISTPLVPVMMLNSLESTYEPFKIESLENPQDHYHILVLGGGHGYDERLPRNSLLSLNAQGRLNEGIRLLQQLPNARMILSGYAGSTPVSQAELLRQTAHLLGVEQKRMLIQPEPQNTKQEAETYRRTFAGEPQVILVTSAAHMPRAMMLFEQAGVNALPSPTNYHLKGENRYRSIGLPSLGNISYLKTAFYEYAAILRYKQW